MTGHPTRRDLLLDGLVEAPTHGATFMKLCRRQVAVVDAVVGHLRERMEIGALLLGQRGQSGQVDLIADLFTGFRLS